MIYQWFFELLGCLCLASVDVIDAKLRSIGDARERQGQDERMSRSAGTRARDKEYADNCSAGVVGYPDTPASASQRKKAPLHFGSGAEPNE